MFTNRPPLVGVMKIMEIEAQYEIIWDSSVTIYIRNSQTLSKHEVSSYTQEQTEFELQ